jgi:sRNA-binding protein
MLDALETVSPAALRQARRNYAAAWRNFWASRRRTHVD